MKNSTINQAVKKAVNDLKKLEYKSIYWNDKTPIYIDRSRTDSHKISYITTKKRNELKKHIKDFKFDTTNATRKKYFFHTSPSKLLQKFFNSTIFWNDPTESKILQTLTQRLYKAQNTGETFKSHTAEEIPNIYHTSNHQIVGSCMQEKPTSFFELHTLFPDNLKLYAQYNKQGVLIARALFWRTKFGTCFSTKDECYLDRIYLNTDDNDLKPDLYYKFYKKVLKAENVELCNFYNLHHAKESKLTGEGEFYGLSNYAPFSELAPSESIDNLEKYPYMDTFCYIDDYGNLTDREEDWCKKLDSTSGGFEEDDSICDCEHCGYEIDRDELIYVEDEGIEVCPDCAVWSDADNCSYLNDNCTYVGGNVESYVLTEDIH